MSSLPDDARIAEYFSCLHACLVKMPPAQQEELLQELQQHLSSLIVRYRAVGLSSREAVEEALRQFGEPVVIGRKMLQEWRLSEQQSARRASARYSLYGLIWSSLFFLFAFDPLLGSLRFSWRPNDFVLMCSAPLLTGFLTGLRYPMQAMASVLRASLTLILNAVAVLGVVFVGFVVFHRPHLSALSFLSLFTLPSFLGTATFYFSGCFRWLVLWLPIGLAAAYLGSACRRGFYRPEFLSH